MSFDWEGQAIVEAADFLVTGEGEEAFRELCRDLLDERSVSVSRKVHAGGLPNLETLPSPVPFVHR